MQFVPSRGSNAATTRLLSRWRSPRAAAQAASIALLSMITACADDPVAVTPDANKLESLTVSGPTVVAAVEFITPSPFKVPATCGGSLEINCVNGVPGEPASFNIARGPILTEWVEAEQAYSFSTTLAVTSVNMLATASGITCTVDFNSKGGASTTFNMAGYAEFSSHTSDGVVNRVDIQANVSGIEPEDVTLRGSNACTLAASFRAQLVAAVTDALSTQTALCGAPGPALFKECPDRGAAARRALRRR